MRLRPIAEQDAGAFHACLDAVARESLMLGQSAAPEFSRVQAFIADTLAAGHPQWVAMADDGQMLGWCDAIPLWADGLRHRAQFGIGVRREQRGRGLGEALGRAVIAQARQQGRIARIDLEVRADNGSAIRLYQRLGFAAGRSPRQRPVPPRRVLRDRRDGAAAVRRRQALLAGSALPLAPLLASEALPVLRVGWDEYAPYQTAPRHAGGEPGGLDVERLRHWLKAAGQPPPRWLQMPFPRQLLALQTGELDAMLDASQVPEREPFAVWTQPYRAERVDLMALASHSLPPPTSLAALRGQRLRIALVRGSRYPGEFANLVDDPGFAALLVAGQAQPPVLADAAPGPRRLPDRRSAGDRPSERAAGGAGGQIGVAPGRRRRPAEAGQGLAAAPPRAAAPPERGPALKLNRPSRHAHGSRPRPGSARHGAGSTAWRRSAVRPGPAGGSGRPRRRSRPGRDQRTRAATRRWKASRSASLK